MKNINKQSFDGRGAKTKPAPFTRHTNNMTPKSFITHSLEITSDLMAKKQQNILTHGFLSSKHEDEQVANQECVLALK